MTATLPQPALAGSAAAAPAPRRPRLLMLTHRLPYPPDRGDRIRSYHELKFLAQHFDVGVACTSEDPVWLQHHQLLRTMAQRVIIQPIGARYSQVRGATALLTGQPITPAYHFRSSLADAILQWHEEQPFDAVLTYCTGMIQYARMLLKRTATAAGNGQSAPRRPIHVLDLVDVDSLKWVNYAQHSLPPMKWIYQAEARRLRAIERGDFDRFDAVTVVSAAEAAAYRAGVGDHPGLTVIRNGVNVEYFHPLPDPNTHTLVFVGVLNYRPNTDGICWFAQQVMPRLRQRLPDAKLLIVGRHPTARVQALGENAAAGVQVVGSVPDVRAYLGECSAAIAPLQIARGVQNKVLEAMASQRACVCSLGAAQGIDAEDGRDFLVADTPEQWVDRLVHVLTDQPFRAQLAAAARRRVEAIYSWDEALQPLLKLLQGQ